MKNVITITALIKKETEKAIMIYGHFPSPNENFGMDCWVPKSIITIDNARVEKDFTGEPLNMAEVTMPTWFTSKNNRMLHNSKAHYAK